MRQLTASIQSPGARWEASAAVAGMRGCGWMEIAIAVMAGVVGMGLWMTLILLLPRSAADRQPSQKVAVAARASGAAGMTPTEEDAVGLIPGPVSYREIEAFVEATARGHFR